MPFFLFPILLVFSIAAIYPIILHFLGKKNKNTILFGPFHFLEEALAKKSKWETLKKYLLLLSRIFLILLFAFIASKPITKPVLDQMTGTQRRIVFLIDDSLSMSYLHEGQSYSAIIKEFVGEYIKGLRSQDLKGGGYFNNDAQLVPQLDNALFYKWLQENTIPKNNPDFLNVLEKHLRLFTSNEENVQGIQDEIIILSDLAFLNNNSANIIQRFNSLAANGIKVYFVHPKNLKLTSIENLKSIISDNYAIENLVVKRGSLDKANKKSIYQANFDFHNFSQKAVRKKFKAFVNNEFIQSGYLEVDASANVEKKIEFQMNTGQWVELKIELEDDNFIFDNALVKRFFDAPPSKILIVNGAPSTIPLKDEFFFFKKAVLILKREGLEIDTQYISLEKLATFEINQFDALFMGNTDIQLGDIEILQKYIQQGGKIFLSLGDKLINKKGETSLWNELLGISIKDLYLAENPREGTEGESVEVVCPECLFENQKSQKNELEKILSLVKTSRYFNLDLKNIKSKTILKYSNGAPMLLKINSKEKKDDASVMLLTTSIDLDDSNLCLSPAFPFLLKGLFEQFVIPNEGQKYLDIKSSGLSLEELKQKAKGKAVIENEDLSLVVANDSELKWKKINNAFQVFSSIYQLGNTYFLNVIPDLSESNFNYNINLTNTKIPIPEKTGSDNFFADNFSGKDGQSHWLFGFAMFLLPLLFVMETFLSWR